MIAAKNDLIAFTLLTKRDYVPARHHTLIAEALEAVERGEINRLMIFMPPRHGKSELTSRRFPAWYLGRNPTKQIISASYNSDLATEFGRDVRNLVADPLYQAIFRVTLRPDSKAADRWNTDQGGSFVSAGVGSGITGRGANVGLIDDPFKDRKEANSQLIRDNVWDWYRSTFYTRLMPGAAIVVTATRWHEDDLCGRLIKAQAQGAEAWNVINLPAIANGPDELGRVQGEALWPEWYPLPTLERIQATIGSYEWQSLYQQAPVSAEGNIFKRTWWQWYREVPAKYDFILQSWDTAFKKGLENDFSVCTTWGLTGNNIHMVDRWKERLEFPELKRTAEALANRFSPHAVAIEDNASGQSLIQELRRETKLPVVAVKVDRDKESRAHAVTPLIEGGRVYLPEWGSWVQDYINCMAAFPSGAHDDDVDSTTMALDYLRHKTTVRAIKPADKNYYRADSQSWLGA